MVPLGMALPPGMRAAIYPKEQWEQAAEEREDRREDAERPSSSSTRCAIRPAARPRSRRPPELIEQMKTGGGIMVILPSTPAAQPIGFPVPLDGFERGLCRHSPSTTSSTPRRAGS